MVALQADWRQAAGGLWNAGPRAVLDAFGSLNRKISRRPATVEDLPNLVRALWMRDPRIRASAVASLRKVTGQDLGDDPEVWLAWWERGGDGYRRRIADLRDIHALYEHVYRAVMTGRGWDYIHGRMTPEARQEIPPKAFAARAEGMRADLRRAFRDASVREVEIDGDRAVLRMRWGKDGLGKDLVLRRDGDLWSFEPFFAE